MFYYFVCGQDGDTTELILYSYDLEVSPYQVKVGLFINAETHFDANLIIKEIIFSYFYLNLRCSTKINPLKLIKIALCRSSYNFIFLYLAIKINVRIASDNTNKENSCLKYPRKLYEEEINKQPCFRYFKGFCSYDLYCHFTHYNEFQLQQLKEFGENANIKRKSRQSKKENAKLPWKSSVTKRNLKLLPTKLPPSLRPLKLNKLSKQNIINKWG